mmetsp:Transcript_37198/g.120415  ORF Transcript_37198/g.120415 Transcript_37198/m.120415 type:complete len:471 (+) Transcript_37198:70-1482(+)
MVCTLLTFIEYPATRRRAPGPYHRLPAGLRSAVASRPSGRRLPAVCTLFTPPRARLLPAPALHGADDAVAVGRRPDEVSAGELHLVRRHHPRRHRLVPVVAREHLAPRPRVGPGAALDLLADGEAERLLLDLHVAARGEAVVEGGGQLLAVQVLADEDHLGLARLVVAPGLVKAAAEDHVDGVVDEALLGMGDVEHALHAVHVAPPLLEQLRDPALQQRQVERALLHRAHVSRGALVDAYAGDARVVLRLPLPCVEQGRARLERALQVEAVDTQHRPDRHVGVGAPLDRREAVDAAQPRLDAVELLRLRDEVRLVQQQPVGEGDLRDRLVDNPLRLHSVEVPLDMLRVDEGHDPVEARKAPDLCVREKRLRHRRRIRHAGRLDDDPIQVQLSRSDTLAELIKNCNEVLPHRAADAAVQDLHNLLVGLELRVLLEELVVDGNVAKLILDDGNLLAVGRRQDVVEQRRFAAA